MSFIKLMAKNSFRTRVFLALAVIGIVIGLATVVTLGVVTEGLKVNFEACFTILVLGLLAMLLKDLK
jgi:putative ABC transport system permease protein